MSDGPEILDDNCSHNLRLLRVPGDVFARVSRSSIVCSPHFPVLRHACGLLKCYTQFFAVLSYGPSIYDVHTEGEGGQAQVDACGRGRGSSPMWTSTQKIKIRVH